MVLTTTSGGVRIISLVFAVVAAVVLAPHSLMFSSNAGGNGWRGGIIFVEGSSATGRGGGGGVGAFLISGSSSNVGIAIAVTAMAGIALAATLVYSHRGNLKSPWSSGRRRKHALLPRQWKTSFDPEGRLCDGGVKLLKKVRSGGVDPSLRSEVWPFLLGVYDLNSSTRERYSIRTKKRKEYTNLRQQCGEIVKESDKSFKLKEYSLNTTTEDSGELSQVTDSSNLEEDTINNTDSEETGAVVQDSDHPTTSKMTVDPDGDGSGITCENASEADTTDSSDSDSSNEPEITKTFLSPKTTEETNLDECAKKPTSLKPDSCKSHTAEDFATWQRIIRVDAIRANAEWVIYSPSQAVISDTKARQLAEEVGLKDYDHLEACRIFHAARLVAILEAYTLYDPEIGYCQGMSDLLSPIVSVMEEDHEAFWCFVCFMKKARHNFRLDEVGIRRQLNIVSRIIKGKDSRFYKHLEKLQAEDCFFVYRMVVVLFRRELNFEQTLCLWEVMWADQAAIRAGMGKSGWGRMRMRAPPTDDLLLYAIAACVLQRRKLIIEQYGSMDEILRECNSMAGHLDVWRLLDDAHDLVVTLHDKI
ncbi:hypothetical protein LguiB_029005 [Lonicera macranthoides]